jgi:hypothetical protein
MFHKIKKDLGSAAKSIGVMQQAAASAACIILKYLHAIEQHFTCCPKGRLKAL